MVLIEPSQNRLIPWWTYDQPRMSVLHSSPPVDQPYCICNSSWDIRTGSSWKAKYDYPRFPRKGQEWPRIHTRVQYEHLQGCVTDKPRPFETVAALRLFWKVQNIRGRSRTSKILQGSWRNIRNSSTALLGFTRIHRDLWIRGESFSLLLSSKTNEAIASVH